MRHFIYFFLIFTFVVVSYGASTFAQSICPRSYPKVEVKRLSTKTKYFRGKSARFLTQVATGHSPKDYAILGLGGGPSWTDFRAKFSHKPIKGVDAYCVVMEELVLNFYIKPSVHIAFEYIMVCCVFKELFFQEKKHIKVMGDW